MTAKLKLRLAGMHALASPSTNPRFQPPLPCTALIKPNIYISVVCSRRRIMPGIAAFHS